MVLNTSSNRPFLPLGLRVERRRIIFSFSVRSSDVIIASQLKEEDYSLDLIFADGNAHDRPKFLCRI